MIGSLKADARVVLGSRPRLGLMNDDFVLYLAASIRDVFSCVLEIELQSTRIHIYAIKKRF